MVRADELKNKAEVCMHNVLFWLKLPISKENVEKGGAYILKLLEPREKRIEELEQKLEQTEKDLADYQFNYPKIKELEQENAELKEELKNWKDEWQEQVQKAIDEGYARTQQTIQLTKAKELIEDMYDKIPASHSVYYKNVMERARQFLWGVEK